MTNESRKPIDLVDDYVHDLLDPATARAVEEFCENDDEGRAALEAARARAETLASLPPVEAPESLVRATMDRIYRRDVRRASYRRWFLGIVGSVTVASLLIVSGFHLYYSRLAASPYDVRLLGQRELLAGSRASVRLAVWDATADRPVAGVPVRLALFRVDGSESLDLGEATTDELGIAQPVFDLPDWGSGNYEIRVLADTPGSDEELIESVQLTRSWKLMLSTDKPVYKPGQTIRVRALSLRRPDLQPVAGREATFAITDPKGNVIFRETDVTSEFGITAIDCPLATEIIEGPYRIECTLGDTTSEVTVDVEKYVLPKFRLAVTLDAPFYAPGDRVKAKLHADYFFGKPVNDAEVQFVAETEGGVVDVVHKETVTTDATGEASVEFDLPRNLVGLERHAGDAGFRLIAQVTDAAGQMQATAVARTVTNDPIRIEVVPEMGRLVHGVANKVFVFTNRADGEPARTSLRITGVDREIETSDLGVASFEVTPKEVDLSLVLVATSLANPEHVGRRHVELRTGNVPRDFVLRTNKAVYTGGESMTVTLLGGGVEPVFLDFLKDGQTVLTRTIEVGAGTGGTTFDLPPELFGTLRLCAYRFGEDGLPVMKLRSVHVTRPEQLTISAGLDRETYRPGDEATVEFTLTDPDGNPVPGALSLAAVDEAVFHVLRQRPGLEGTFFELERDLLEPVYAIYGSWMPRPGEPNFDGRDVPVAERNEFEQALFARTTQRAEAAPGIFVGEPKRFDADIRLAPDGGVAISDFTTEATSPLTLVANSHPRKVSEIEQRQRSGLRSVRSAWGWFVVWCVLATLASITAMFPRVGIALTLLLGTWIGAKLVFPRIYDGVAMSELEDSAAKGVAAGAEARWDDTAVDGFKVEMPLIIDPESSEDAGGAPTEPTRVRRSFPETLLWRPQLVTDDEGRATLTVPLADSITTWRLSASAVSADGRLGSLQDGVRVFQPFFVDLDLPVALVRNDEVAVPVVVYNYLDEPQTVELELANADWFELLDDAAGDEARFQRIELGPGEVRSTHYRLRAKDVGSQKFLVTARANGVADAIEKEIAVDPDGRRVETVVNGSLDQPATIELEVPENAIPGSVTAVVKLYPSGFSQLVEGLDGIFQQPHGCFEQTSSTTYPNILALQYLRESGQSVPEVEATARQFIHLGYQRLLGFEIDGGGFDWFGNPPANVTLTAYGLHEFRDMAKVHDVDPQLIERTRRWLLSKRQRDGSWKVDAGMLNDGLAGAVQRGRDLDLATTAYVAWAVYGDGYEAEGRPTLDYLLAQRPEAIENPYTLAMVTNALFALRANDADVRPYVDRLLAERKESDDGKQAWWELARDERTSFYGGGESADVEVTALATLALLEAKSEPAVVRSALTWLVSKRTANGTWASTQATVLALRALIRGTAAPLGGEDGRSFEVAVDGETVRKWTVDADQAEVLQLVNVSERVGPGTTALRITETTDTGTGYQVAFRYHVPEAAVAEEPEPLSIELEFDRTDLAVSDTIVGTATVLNRMPSEAPMVIVDLPIPAGFRIDPIDLEELRASGDIAKFQVNARSAVVYLRGLTPGNPLVLKYRLEATMPVKLTVPPATVYEYYDRDKQGRGEPLEITVGERT